MKLLLFAQSIIIIWLAVSWAFVFWYIIQHGSVTLVEPVTWILRAEFCLAALITVAALTLIFWLIRRK